MKAVRVELKAPELCGPTENMTFDMILDDKNRPRPGIPFCGWWGRLNSNQVSMVVALPDGRVDFGSDEDTRDPDDRYGRINFHSKVIEPGELVTYSDAEVDEMMFRVGRVVDLLE